MESTRTSCSPRGQQAGCWRKASIDERFDQEGDWIVRQLFSQADLQKSPEEYAAHHGHLWACFSLDRYRFQDPSLGAWVRRLGEIFGDANELERCRQRFFTPEELREARKERDDF